MTFGLPLHTDVVRASEHQQRKELCKMYRRAVIAASIRIYALVARATTGFGVMVAAGSGVRVTSEVDALFAAMSARAGATFISFTGRAPPASGPEKLLPA
jgi:hypothetical protein